MIRVSKTPDPRIRELLSLLHVLNAKHQPSVSKTDVIILLTSFNGCYHGGPFVREALPGYLADTVHLAFLEANPDENVDEPENTTRLCRKLRALRPEQAATLLTSVHLWWEYRGTLGDSVSTDDPATLLLDQFFSLKRD